VVELRVVVAFLMNQMKLSLVLLRTGVMAGTVVAMAAEEEMRSGWSDGLSESA